MEIPAICSHVGGNCSCVSYVSYSHVNDNHVSDSLVSDSHVSDIHVNYNPVSEVM